MKAKDAATKVDIQELAEAIDDAERALKVHVFFTVWGDLPEDEWRLDYPTVDPNEAFDSLEDLLVGCPDLAGDVIP